jgi:hypothetical protein
MPTAAASKNWQYCVEQCLQQLPHLLLLLLLLLLL